MLSEKRRSGVNAYGDDKGRSERDLYSSSEHLLDDYLVGSRANYGDAYLAEDMWHASDRDELKHSLQSNYLGSSYGVHEIKEKRNAGHTRTSAPTERLEAKIRMSHGLHADDLDQDLFIDSRSALGSIHFHEDEDYPSGLSEQADYVTPSSHNFYQRDIDQSHRYTASSSRYSDERNKPSTLIAKGYPSQTSFVDTYQTTGLSRSQSRFGDDDNYASLRKHESPKYSGSGYSALNDSNLSSRDDIDKHSLSKLKSLQKALVNEKLQHKSSSFRSQNRSANERKTRNFQSRVTHSRQKQKSPLERVKNTSAISKIKPKSNQGNKAQMVVKGKSSRLKALAEKYKYATASEKRGVEDDEQKSDYHIKKAVTQSRQQKRHSDKIVSGNRKNTDNLAITDKQKPCQNSKNSKNEKLSSEISPRNANSDQKQLSVKKEDHSVSRSKHSKNMSSNVEISFQNSSKMDNSSQSDKPEKDLKGDESDAEKISKVARLKDQEVMSEKNVGHEKSIKENEKISKSQNQVQMDNFAVKSVASEDKVLQKSNLNVQELEITSSAPKAPDKSTSNGQTTDAIKKPPTSSASKTVPAALITDQDVTSNKNEASEPVVVISDIDESTTTDEKMAAGDAEVDLSHACQPTDSHSTQTRISQSVTSSPSKQTYRARPISSVVHPTVAIANPFEFDNNTRNRPNFNESPKPPSSYDASPTIVSPPTNTNLKVIPTVGASVYNKGSNPSNLVSIRVESEEERRAKRLDYLEKEMEKLKKYQAGIWMKKQKQLQANEQVLI